MSDDDLLRIFHRDALMECLAGDNDPQWLLDRALATWAKRLSFPVAVVQKLGAGALRAAPLLTVGTIHSVKGGESACVYLAPDLSPSAYQEWEYGDPDPIVRCGYVGMTRASEELVLLAPASKRVMDF